MKKRDFTIEDIIVPSQIRDVLKQINDKAPHITGVIAIVLDDEGCFTYYSTLGDIDKALGVLERFKYTLLQGDE